MNSTRKPPPGKRTRRGPPTPRATKPSHADLMGGVFRWIYSVRQVLDSVLVQAAALREQTKTPRSPLAGCISVTALNDITGGVCQTDAALVDLFANVRCITTDVPFSDVFDLLSRSAGGKS